MGRERARAPQRENAHSFARERLREEKEREKTRERTRERRYVLKQSPLATALLVIVRGREIHTQRQRPRQKARERKRKRERAIEGQCVCTREVDILKRRR